MSSSANNAGNLGLNNDVLPASLMAAALLGVAIFASALAAQQPDRSNANQKSPEPVINNADKAAIQSEVEAPIYGLTLEKGDDGRVVVAAVEPDSRPWKAGFREGDYLVAVGETQGLSYDKFLEHLRDVATASYEGDSFAVAILRDGQRQVIEVPGAGRSPDDLRKLQTKSEKAIEEKLEPDDSAAMPRDKYARQSVATADIEEYLKLAQLAQEKELSARDQRRFGELATVVVGGGYGWGGVGGVGGFGPPSGTTTVSPGPSAGSNWYRAGANGQPVDAFEGSTAASTGAQPPETGIGTGDAAGAGTSGTGIGDGQPAQGAPQSSRLGAEMRRLREMQAAGDQLTPDQTQRLNALTQLSQFANTQPGGLNSSLNSAQNPQLGQMSPQQMQTLQRAAQSGQLNPAQRQSLLQMQRRQLMSEFARSAPGANRNMPAVPQRGLNNRNLNNPGLNNPGLNTPGVGGSPGGVPGAAGVGASGAGSAGTGAGVGTGGSGVGVQGAGSGIGDAN